MPRGEKMSKRRLGLPLALGLKTKSLAGVFELSVFALTFERVRTKVHPLKRSLNRFPQFTNRN